MSIRWDSLLVRSLAAELHDRLVGARLRAIRLDARTRDILLQFRDRTLVWRLHPERGYPLIRDPIEPDPGDLRLRARVRRVHAPADERIVIFELVGERSGDPGFEIVVELMGNQLNAMVLEGPDRTVRHVLRTREGARPARGGHPWTPPPPSARAGAREPLELDGWLEILETVPPLDRPSHLVRTVAWTSPLNADAFLGADLDDDTLRPGYQRWRDAVEGEPLPGAPVLLETERGPQPYPFALPGTRGEPMDTLMEAFERCAGSDTSRGAPPPALGLSPSTLERLEHAVAQSERKVVRLEAEKDALDDPEALRATGDLILARFGEIRPGASRVTLTDFEGAEVELELDPSLPPHENAGAWYDRAARSERAARRLPGLIREAEESRRRLQVLLEAARSGEATAEEVDAALPRRAEQARPGDEGKALPYRTFRSSGGLEIRVGRGARHNDDLTFHHSAPDDVWLHARHTAGAHVILRWPGPGNPPARDLQEAGTLAALHSRARTSSSVPVDWTLRKYVRKPRGAAPGSVVPDRVQTIFVRPDEELAERLADGS